MKGRTWMAILALAGLAWAGYQEWAGKSEPVKKERNAKANQAVTVTLATARSGVMRTRLEALGTVIPGQWVVVRPRVEGLLRRMVVQEGATVQAGELLAEIDPAPFQIALDQAKGQLQRDQALLANARLDADRLQTLLAKHTISRQQLDTQRSLVNQYQGTVEVDQALVAQATLQLSYTRVTAPIDGVVGLRQVDAGNTVRPTDANGLITIAQVRPVQILFSLPEDHLPALQQAMARDSALAVELYDRGRQKLLATGALRSLDNQIDPATGTVKLKAEAANEDGQLYPHQFVNVTLVLAMRQDAVLIPTPALQRGRQGAFVYLVGEAQTVTLRPVQAGPAEGEQTAIEAGLASGDQVVVAGTDKLREGSRVVTADRRESDR